MIAKVNDNIQNNDDWLSQYNNLENGYDIKLHGENHTTGMIIGYMIYKIYFEEKNTLSFCGSQKFHPHDNFITIRVVFKEDVKDPISEIRTMMESIASKSIHIIKQIKSQL